MMDDLTPPHWNVEMSDWLLKKAEAWDRCWPGNMNVEVLVDDLTKRIQSDADEIDRLQAELREAQDLIARARQVNLRMQSDTYWRTPDNTLWPALTDMTQELAAFLAKVQP